METIRANREGLLKNSKHRSECVWLTLGACQVPTNPLHQPDRVTKCVENLMWKVTIMKLYLLISLVPEETELDLLLQRYVHHQLPYQ